ncbi:hypothetical protein V6N12_050244 [Hibiscus sabdariffa]|uniref:Uncharacterized protein n=1 Tax=Hibiscus sabdariffa TaxID=183260 RepID=A0ABR2GCE5_9ROSI
MANSFYVDPSRIAGGLTLWWTNDANVSIIEYEKHFIDTKLSVNEEEDWFMTFIYGPPYNEDKQAFWGSLSNLRSNTSDKWCIIRDSNIVTRPEDKSARIPFISSQASCYYDFLDRSCLMELLIKGGSFTWSVQRSEDEAILERLDRVLVSLEWSILPFETL